jgi:hypothetical protein
MALVVIMSLVVAGGAGAGCGGRSAFGSWDAGGNDNGTGNNNNTTGDAAVDPDARPGQDGGIGPDGSVGACTDDDQCALAIRTDNCCQVAYPELVTYIQADPCLARWPLIWHRVPQSCLDAWDPECDYIDCVPSAPVWRSAACRADGAGCESVPECDGPDDCTLAIDTRKCCPCPEAVPPLLIEQDPCLVPLQGGNSPGWCAPQACPAMPCTQCLPEADDPPRCNAEQQVCWDDQPGW